MSRITDWIIEQEESGELIYDEQLGQFVGKEGVNE